MTLKVIDKLSESVQTQFTEHPSIIELNYRTELADLRDRNYRPNIMGQTTGETLQNKLRTTELRLVFTSIVTWHLCDAQYRDPCIHADEFHPLITSPAPALSPRQHAQDQEC